MQKTSRPALIPQEPAGVSRPRTAIPAYRRSARKRQDRPVTPEAAGSSPVAPVTADAPPTELTCLRTARRWQNAGRASGTLADVRFAKAALLADDLHEPPAIALVIKLDEDHALVVAEAEPALVQRNRGCHAGGRGFESRRSRSVGRRDRVLQCKT
jgi:hypothetical protein